MSISTSTTSLLSCQTTLSPPLSSIGSEEIRIEFSTGSPCWNVAFSADGKLLAACFGAPNSCVRIWELQTLTLIATLEGLHPRTIRYCSFAPVAKNYTLATASFDGTVGIWERDVNLQLNQNNMEEWECIAQLEGHESECKCVEWNNSATLLATCGRDKTVWLWDCSLDGNIGGSRGTSGDFECLSVLNGHDGDVKSVLFAPSRGIFGDGDEICISGSYDNTIRIWAEDAGDWYCALCLHESHTIWSLALAPGSIRLISGSADGSCGIYKLYTAQEIKTKAGNLTLQSGNKGTWCCVGRLTEAHQSAVMSVAYASANAGHGRFASCGDSLQIYREALESTSEHPLFSLEASSKVSNLNSVKWHPRDGSILATGGDDGNVHIWRFGAQ